MTPKVISVCTDRALQERVGREAREHLVENFALVQAPAMRLKLLQELITWSSGRAVN